MLAIFASESRMVLEYNADATLPIEFMNVYQHSHPVHFKLYADSV